MTIEITTRTGQAGVAVKAIQGVDQDTRTVGLWGIAEKADRVKAGRVNSVTLETSYGGIAPVVQHDGTKTLLLNSVAVPERTIVSQVNSAGSLEGYTVEPRSQAAGWGDGEFFMLEADANGNLIVEPGRSHRKIYATAGAHGYTAARIASEAGVSEATVTNTWLSANPTWGGSPAKALAKALAFSLWDLLTSTRTPQSHRLMLERGYDYSDLGGLMRRYVTGESFIHPCLITAYGAGANPLIAQIRAVDQGGNFAVIGVDIGNTDLIGGKRVLLADLQFVIEPNVQGPEYMTFYRTKHIDAHDVPYNGTNGPTWHNSVTRVSGMFISKTNHVLLLYPFFDHNGWQDGYDPIEGDPTMPQPPNMYSHNLYVQHDVRDITVRGAMSARAASMGLMVRPGGHLIDNVMLDNNIAGNVLGGNYKSSGWVGQHSLIMGNLVTSAGYRRAAWQTGGYNWGFDMSGVDGGAVGNIVCHRANPADPAEQAAKPSGGMSLKVVADRPHVFDDTKVRNWNDTDRNLGGLNLSALDQTTIQKYAAQKLNKPGATIADYMTFWRSLAPSQYRAELMALLTYFRTAFGTHVAPRTVPGSTIFKPDLRGEGMLWTNRLNWSLGDLPMAGDSVDMHGNFVRFGEETVTVANLRLRGGILDVTSGKLTAAAYPNGDTGRVRVRTAGQFFAPASTGIDYMAESGRLALTAATTAGLEIGGDAEALFGPALTIPAGKRLHLAGDKCWAGWDGAGNATLTLAGELSLAAVAGKLPRIRKFKRRGDNPDPTVNATVALSGPLKLDLTGVGVGSQVVLEANSITGNFSGQTIIGLAAGRTAVVNKTATTVTVVVT